MSKKLSEIITNKLVDFYSYILQAHSNYIIQSQTNLFGLLHKLFFFKCTLKTAVSLFTYN